VRRNSKVPSPAFINFFRQHVGRGNQQRARLVERVDQDVEAPRLVALL
jgi:hypothetical protein